MWEKWSFPSLRLVTLTVGLQLRCSVEAASRSGTLGNCTDEELAAGKRMEEKKGSPLKANASLMRLFRDVFDKAAQRLWEKSGDA